MGHDRNWDNAFTAPAYDAGEITAFAAATLATELLCPFAANPHRAARG